MKERVTRRLPILLAGIVIIIVSRPARSLPGESGVSARQEKLVIPTYPPGAPERNPMFYFGRTYQGAKGPVYPYPFLDVLTDERVDKPYAALILENEYVRYCVLPEVGGRIFEAVDKTNGYDFFYRQHVIKPALIGMLGAWISGGVEWNIPHHHRATTFLPVDWKIEEADDGSKTVWVGELELRHRMRWLVGLTLHPRSPVLEVAYRIINRTPFAHSVLCWANAAVHANENFQIIFPPGTGLATFHGKNQFSHWPISREVYNGVDYSQGVDVSWWKNHPSPTSFFAFGSEEDFFAGYDHGKNAGVVFVGDHTLVPGKKLWTWGTGSEGARWEKILTDRDGPYLELMFGSFSDNQPDYSWVGPGEVKKVTQYWYPIRAIGPVKNANADAACNLEVREGGKVFLGFVATAVRKNARIVLEAGEKLVFEKTTDLGPGEPFMAEVQLLQRTEAESLHISLTAEDGREVVGYRPKKIGSPSLPDPATPPPAPPEIRTSEELYLTGLRLEQFYNPAFEPYPYYEEALKRDPDDSRVNVALGRLYLMRGMFAEAEAHLLRAVARAGKDHTRPKDGEASYYLGVGLRFLGKEAEAEEAFGRASWDVGWTAPAALQMAELATGQGRYLEALEQAKRAAATNASDSRAGDLKATLLRKLSRLEEAERAARRSLAADPLDFWAANELRTIRSARGLEKDSDELAAGLKLKMRDAAENYLELASDYAACGLYDEAVDVLSRLAKGTAPEASCPMLHYDLAYYYHKSGDESGARQRLQMAMMMPSDYGFPFRLEDIAVLKWAESRNPQDARSPYYLGNLLFDRQPEAAIAEWEKAAGLDGTFATVHRNLGLALSRVKNDLPRAVSCLERAVACDPTDPRLYSELDELYDLSDISPQKRLDRLSKNHVVVAKRDDSLAREIVLLVELGRYDRAIELLGGHHFHVWEGGGEIHSVYVDAHLLRGQKAMAEGNHERALRDFRAALEYPDNLEVGRPTSGGRDAEIYYFIGLALDAGGNNAAAGEAFERSAEAPVGPSELTNFQGWSWRKLGQEAKARGCFERLIQFAREKLEKAPSMDYFAKFGEKESARRREASLHFLLGLGLRGLRREAEAKAEFQEALKLYPQFSRVRRQLQ
jgi:tetratricopeptide (TPR) repeat protein